MFFLFLQDANVESVINLKAPTQIKDPRKPHIVSADAGAGLGPGPGWAEERVASCVCMWILTLFVFFVVFVVLPFSSFACIRVLQLCTRYADFASGILLLNEGYNDPILTANLARLSGEVNKFLLRSAVAPAAMAARPDLRQVYLINAYGAILRVLGARPPADSSESAAFWAAQAGAQISAYVEAELRAKFAAVIQTLERLEAMASARQRGGAAGAAAAAAAAAAPTDAELRGAVAQFNSGYAAAIKSLHEGVHSNFALEGRDGAGVGGGAGGSSGGGGAGANDAAGHLASSRQIFMQLLSQLLLYHQRFDALSPHKLAPKTEITAAIKKYTQQ